MQLTAPPEVKLVWAQLAGELRMHAKHVAMALDLSTARTGFEALSETLQRLLKRLGNPLDRPLQLAFCPMAAHSQGASWVQEGAQINNAYFGPSMSTCGEVTQQVAPGAYVQTPDEEKPADRHGGREP